MSDPNISFVLQFEGELLVPESNLIAYRQIYALENWFRRICLAAWMGEYGCDWIDKVDQKLRKNLESRVRRNRRRLYLGAESHDDLIWQATHAELLQLLVDASINVAIQELTGADGEFLQTKLDEVREIRNLLAHNRALASRTHTILAGLLASLEEAIDNFKMKVLYGPREILGPVINDEMQWLGEYLDELLEGNDWSRFQAFVAIRDQFIEYVCLPAGPSDRWPDAQKLLRAFEEHLNDIVAFCLNKQGDEFIILAPLKLTVERQAALCATFARNPDIWTDVEFENQSPRFICSPKIWFYENGSPFRQ